MKRLLSLLLLVVCLTAAGCSTEYSVDFFAMDTFMSITAFGKNAEKGALAAQEEVNRLDQLLSKTDENSEIFQLNAGEEPALSPETAAVLAEARQRCEETGGSFNPFLYDLVSLWGIGTDQAHVPSEQEVAEALALRRIDLGGIGKGFATDRAVEILRQHGVENALIALGGNVYAMGHNPENDQPWRAAIQDPDGGSYIGYLDVEDVSIVTSGDYERYFEQDGVRYHHIFDPKTGFPAQNGLRSVTIVSADSSLADCYSTALFVMGLEDALAFCEGREDFGAIFITEDRSVYLTSGLEDCFTLTSEDRGYHYGEP